jgi:hypothetical protein
LSRWYGLLRPLDGGGGGTKERAGHKDFDNRSANWRPLRTLWTIWEVPIAF